MEKQNGRLKLAEAARKGKVGHEEDERAPGLGKGYVVPCRGVVLVGIDGSLSHTTTRLSKRFSMGRSWGRFPYPQVVA